MVYGLHTLELSGAVVFFDLAGTLMEIDTELPENRARILLEVGRQLRRVVLVTGQDSNDPQVRQLLSIFLPEKDIDFTAYTTRGGMRLIRRGMSFEPDEDYLAHNRLEPAICGVVIEIINETLGTMALIPLIPVVLLDKVAIRINLAPSERLHFAEVLKYELESANDLARLGVVIEGRTSVFVMRAGVDKKLAVSHELAQLALGREPLERLYYVGNEFIEGGNDREVFGLPLKFLALGDCGEIPQGVQCKSIGDDPEDLYRILKMETE